MHAQGAENRVGEALGVAGWKFFAEYHAAQVEGAAEEVLGELEIAVGAYGTRSAVRQLLRADSGSDASGR